MDLTWPAEEPRDRVALARRRLDAVIATCGRAHRPGSHDQQERLSRVLLDLVANIRSSDPTIGFEIARILADAPWAPEGACGALAQTELESAARPIAGRPRLGSTDLVKLVTRSSAAQRRDIAGGGPLPGAVVRALVDDRDGAVVIALLGNEANALAPSGIDRLVARARREPGLRSALARRPELDREQAARLATSLSVDGRRRLAARYGSDVTTALAPDETDRVDEAEWVRKRDARGDLLPSTLLSMARRGWSDGFREGLRRLAGPPAESATQAAPIASTLRRAGVDRAALAAFGEPSATCAADEPEPMR